MIITDKKRLTQSLKVMWSLWERKNPDEWPSNSKIENFHDFFIDNTKIMGFNDNLDELSFWYNAIINNESNLNKKTLTEDNVAIPQKRTFSVDYTRIEWEKVANYHQKDIECYLTKTQLDDEFYFFTYEDYIDTASFMYTHKDYIDGELEHETVDIKEITPQQKESVDNYMTNLSEGELDYMVKKLLGTHLHRKSK